MMRVFDCGRAARRGLALLMAAMAVAAIPGTGAAAILGACASYEFNQKGAQPKRGVIGEIDAEGYIVRGSLVPVIREGAPILSGPQDTARRVGDLAFAQRVGIVRRIGDYLEIKNDLRDAATVGWVHGDDLLCRAEPVVSQTTGLEQKFYIRTKSSFQGDSVEPVRASLSVDDARCDGAGSVRCRELTRFSLYYVHAIDFDRRRLLLLGEYRATVTAPLIGWVDIADGFLWETRFGLRPRPDLVHDAASAPTPAQVGQERFVCVNETKAAALAGGRCDIPVLGGERWFSYPIRIPVIERIEGEEGLFSVILPVAGVGEGVSADIFEQAQGLEDALRSLQQLRKLDVFFLIDGTQSMEPHIDAIVGRGGTGPGILGAITEAFNRDPRFSGTQVRFGYRVYRDLYDGQGGIGEGLPLGGECDLTDQDLALEYQRFTDGVRAITTRVPASQRIGRDPDHEENLFFGLYQAVDDMSTCDEHVKLLFVIGDTGYSGESQVAQGGTAISVDDVVDFLTLNMDPDVDPIIPFFVQVPRALGGAPYESAYDKFLIQARAIAGRVLGHLAAGAEGIVAPSVDDHLISLDGRTIPEAQAALVDRVLGVVEGFGDQKPINEIIAELKGGEALVNIITQLQGAEEYGNLPGLRLAQIERRLCDELGPACTERVYNTIASGFIRDSDDVVTDVWMSFDEFQQWQGMLEVFRDISGTDPDRLAGLIIQQMTRTIQGGIGDVKLTPEDAGQSLASFLERRRGLPVGELTPLLQYSLSDLMTVRSQDAQVSAELGTISVCELGLLASWLEKRREIFASVESGQIPEFELDRQTVCADARHPTPLIKLTGYRAFSKPGMHFRHALEGRTIFWVPSDYLP